jgi:Protein of unknown function (DUF3761)/G5 domain
MSSLFVILLLLALVALVIGLINPSLFKRLFKEKTSRKFVGLSFSALVVLFFILSGVTSASQHNSPQSTTSTPKISKPVITTKSVVTTSPVAFTKTSEEDGSLAKGTTTVKTVGVNGIQTQTWLITYTNGKQSSKKLVSNVTTAPAVNEVDEIGTYVAPAPQSPTCTNGTYVNLAGNTVCSPEASSSVPSGATAQCVDGTYSFSQSRSGTCSHHGGVSQWLD